MRTGIITFHFPYNCGAVLQCAALQTVLEDLGADVSVINYRPQYHTARYAVCKNPFSFFLSAVREAPPEAGAARKLYLGLRSFGRTVLSWGISPVRLPQRRKFAAFLEKYIHETAEYRDPASLKKGCGDYGLLIAGSDQLWAAQLTEMRFDPSYFLQFGSPAARKITYAVGANFTPCPDAEKLLPGLLSGLSVISLRESRFLEDVRRAAPGTPLRLDPDPTLLLRAEDYARFLPAGVPERDPYILTYCMPNETQQTVYEAAHLLSKQTGFRVIDVCGNPAPGNLRVRDHRTVGPDEFLWYVKNARFVLTNSFHGTAFSVIFQKHFCTVPHLRTGNRVSELLERLGLGDRTAVSAADAAARVQAPLQFDTALREIEGMRASSIEYLRENLAAAGELRSLPGRRNHEQ